MKGHSSLLKKRKQERPNGLFQSKSHGLFFLFKKRYKKKRKEEGPVPLHA